MTRSKRIWILFWGGRVDFLLNEQSLYGQFQSMEAFLESLEENSLCFQQIHQCKNGKIWKTADFYKCRVSGELTVGDLKGIPCTDALRRLRIQLDKEIETEPYWDEAPVHDYGIGYYLGEMDVSATAVAEAAEKGQGLISFRCPEYEDQRLVVRKEDQEYQVYSIYSLRYLAETLGDQLELDGDTRLKIRYRGTRVDCSFLEREYGSRILEKEEYASLVATLDKLAAHESWDSIALDDGLMYKKYTPASLADDWFRNTQYRDQTIMKFRFSQKLRGFGYRKGERFRLLRLERDHRRSDKG